MRIFEQLDADYAYCGRMVYMVVDGEEEFRIIRINPNSTTYIEE